MSAPRFFVPDLTPAATRVSLPESEAHHFRHVLRGQVGDDVRLFDGRGHEWLGRVEHAKGSDVAVALVRALPAIAEPPIAVTIAAGVLKGQAMDELVRDATMLGAARIIPLWSAHLAAGKRPPARSVEHWHRVAVASAKQCGRAVVPEIEAPVAVDAVIARTDWPLMVMLVEPAAASGSHRIHSMPNWRPTRPTSAIVFSGPEGGWSPEEVTLAADRGVELLALGPRTLRAEAAPAAALTALWTMWGW